MKKIADNGDPTLQGDFAINLDHHPQDLIDIFDEYLTYVFEDKMKKHVNGAVAVQDNVLLFNLLQMESFYPQKNQNHQTAIFFYILAWKKLPQQCLLSCRTPRKQLKLTYQVQSESTVRQ